MKDSKEYSKEEENKNKLYTVKEMDPDDQPRERALKHGVKVLSTPDLWALILRTGLHGNPITEICRDIMRSCNGSLFELERMPRNMILKIPGIGPTKALQIEAVMELIRRYSSEKTRVKVKINGPDALYSLMRPLIGNLPHEEIWVLFINRKNEVVGEMNVSTGSSVASVFDLKKILREAILRDADGIALAHNHPSGQLRPSIQDDRITEMLRAGCKSMDIRMIDHIIVTADSYYSYSNEGRL